MRPVSQEFLDALRFSHVIAASCDLIFPGETTPVPVAVKAGSIRIDRTAQSRRAGRIEIPWSLEIGAQLGIDIRTLPLGGYALVRRGLRYSDGTTEQVLLGRLRVESVSWDTLETAASLELADRMAQVRDESLSWPHNFNGWTPAGAAVHMIQWVFGDTIAYHTPYNPPTVMGDVIYTGDRAAALAALEQGYGAETYFDANGDFVFDEKPGDAEPVVWTVDASASGVMVNAAENLDRTGIYNGVLVQGQPEADQPPVSALATFDDPASPIRWGGPFGRVLLVADSSSVVDAGQAAATAQALLQLRLKQTRSLELTAAPNPALEAGDTIRVVFPDGRDEVHLIDAVETDLATAAQRIVTRTQASPSATTVTAPDDIAELLSEPPLETVGAP